MSVFSAVGPAEIMILVLAMVIGFIAGVFVVWRERDKNAASMLARVEKAVATQASEFNRELSKLDHVAEKLLWTVEPAQVSKSLVDNGVSRDVPPIGEQGRIARELKIEQQRQYVRAQLFDTFTGDTLSPQARRLVEALVTLELSNEKLKVISASLREADRFIANATDTGGLSGRQSVRKDRAESVGSTAESNYSGDPDLRKSEFRNEPAAMNSADPAPGLGNSVVAWNASGPVAPPGKSVDMSVDAIMKLYNCAVDDRQARELFREHYHPIRVGTINAVERRRSPALGAQFREAQDGDFFALATTRADVYWVVPRLGLTIEAVSHGAGALGEVFKTPGHDPALYYSHYRVEQPACFKRNGDRWELLKPGKLHLGPGA